MRDGERHEKRRDDKNMIAKNDPSDPFAELSSRGNLIGDPQQKPGARCPS